ncbi:MAG: 2-hydroxyacyl-CoA dehydratase family protein [Syntrophorhabdaceae bacterium]|nr:2-hydroxyacyl-CoA dehydratase family protein [Syntrophorhabdaceae bacterium]
MNEEKSYSKRVEEEFKNYGKRVKELKASGKRVIGYLSPIVPVEIITASGAIPIRLKGDVYEAVTTANGYMETIVCPFVRNVFDSALKGKYGFLDGLVMPHLCDSMDRTADIWNYNLGLNYFHFLNVPHVTDEPSLDFFKEILSIFISSLERFLEREIREEDLRMAIEVHNRNRGAMRKLYELRKSEPPLINGVEMMKVLVATMGLPVGESISMVEGLIEEVSERKLISDGHKPRIMIIGDQIDYTSLSETIEDGGGIHVMDDISIGSKAYWADVEVDKDPLYAIAERYLRKLKLPTFVESSDTYSETVEKRFGYLKDFIEEFRVDGVILVTFRYCDPYGFEVPLIKGYIEDLGIPVLYMEDEYSASTIPRAKTRIEAFLEMLME